MLCSLIKVREYARKTTESADLVAQAAYQSCYAAWETFLQTECRDTRLCGDAVFEGQLRAAHKRGWTAGALTEVMEVRRRR